MTQGLLRIYVEDKDGNVVSFPPNEEQAVVKDWTRTAERMAGAPSVTGTVMHRLCLDNLWTKKEFVIIGGERYYVKQVPTSSKDTEDVRYKHDVTLVSERDILENVYFFDVVTKNTDPQTSGKPRSNTTDFSFFGDLNELVERLNDSLSYSKIYDAKGVNGFCIVIDEDVEIGEAKEVSITDAYFATAMQEIYNVFGVPYYWVGKICHVGYAQNEIEKPFEYGKDNGLLSVSKNNSEYRLINRITGMGSADNIPYYYPNTDPNGIAEFDTYNIINANNVNVLTSLLTSRVGSEFIGKQITLSSNPSSKEFAIPANEVGGYNGAIASQSGNNPIYWSEYVVQIVCYLPKGVIVDLSTLNGSAESTKPEWAKILDSGSEIKKRCRYYDSPENISNYAYEEVPVNKEIDREGYWQFQLWIPWRIQSLIRTEFGPIYAPDYLKINKEGSFKVKYNNDELYSLSIGDKIISYTNSGITIPNIEKQPCDKSDVVLKKDDSGVYRLGIEVVEKVENPSTIIINNVKRIPIMTNLMPSVYRETEGAERFYNAVNEKYINDNGEYYSFNNPYLPNEPLEGKQDFEDIKPTINGITNENGELFGEIAEVAFDDTDSDDLSIEDAKDANTNTAKPVHPYFYVKLHKFSGENGFNLFKQGLAQGAMTFNFITGSCAGCSFKVKVSEGKQVDNHYEFQNLVQVDEQGNIVAGDSGDKIKASNPIASQQDTMTNSVWIALEKDNSTFGVLMPNATNNYRPQGKTELREGDKFVITNILLPTQYITAAEKRLEAALIKYMSENNDEKFTFSIKFSRIYLQKHIEDIVPYLNENARINVKYNNTTYPLYVSSYTQKYDGNILDEISVELSEELTITQNKSKQQMDSIMGNVNEQINSALKDNNNSQQGVTDGDLVAIKNLINNKLSKVTSDSAAGLITFLQGIISKGTINAMGGVDSLGEILARDGITIGDFVSGLLDGRGAKIDASGNAEMESLRVRSYLQVMELIVNRIRTMDGDWMLTEGDTIESVEEITDAEGHVSYRLKLKEQWEGYYTAQAEGNVVRGIINTLAEGSGTYYTSWMLVKDVDTTSNTILVDIYPDDETPAGQNFPPCEMMKIARWGNAVDESRQSCIYLSSTEGVIKKLIRVTKPIIDKGNDGFIIGNLPEWLTSDPSVPVSKGDDAVYVKTLLYQNIQQVDYKGKRQPVYVDRGNWIENPAEPYHFEAINSITGTYETSDVWYSGCKWRCIKDCPTDAPKWNSMQWMQIEGNPDFAIEIEVENGGLLDFDYFAEYGTTLDVTGKIYNMDVTQDILDTDVTWTRKSKDASGNERTESDNIWNNLGRTGKTLHLALSDIDYDSLGLPSMLCFTARALLRDGVTAEDSVSII